MKVMKSVMLGSLLALSSAAMAEPVHADAAPVNKAAQSQAHRTAQPAKPVSHKKTVQHVKKKPVKKPAPKKQVAPHDQPR
ncbi:MULTISPECIES: hypothetical protein [Yersiniaceae]|nr:MULTISPECIES: hypothetical protein [Yersiniaceae]MBS0969854.1 hypothetical protein [Nissabacter archeti]WKZ91079.1 hypothetical protein P0E69_12560 [Chimaeribacter arupi]